MDAEHPCDEFGACIMSATEIKEKTMKKTIKEHVEDLKAKGVQCNCDLDNWQPEQTTGHSCVCRIHQIALELAR